VLVESFSGVKDHTTFALNSANTETLPNSAPGCTKLLCKVQRDHITQELVFDSAMWNVMSSTPALAPEMLLGLIRV